MDNLEKKLYEYIEGNDILTIQEDNKVPLIEGVLYKGQYVMFTAEEKVGKTVLSQQLVCSLSSGTDLFEAFDIDRGYKVWYMFNEVRMDELKGRFIRMKNAVPLDTGNVTLIPFKFHFNTPAGMKQLDHIVKERKDNPPDIIILDALYKAVKGSLVKDDVVNDFNHTFSKFAHDLGGCARIVVHHLNKPSKDLEKGGFKARTDKDAYGSTFLAADVDHIFRLEKWGNDPNTKDRVLKCETQRSGDIIETTRLRLIEPNPLYYTIVSIHTEEKAELIKLLNKNRGLDIQQVMKKMKLSRSVSYVILKELINENLIDKTKKRPVLYYLKSKGNPYRTLASSNTSRTLLSVSTK